MPHPDGCGPQSLPRRFPWFPVFTLSLLFASALWIRLGIIERIEFAGRGDMAFYFNVAQNFAEHGRLEIDYVWNYLNPPESLTHPAGDYWPIFGSILMALPLALGGDLHTVLLFVTMFGLLTGVGTLFLAHGFSVSRLGALASCAFVLFHPKLLNDSTSTDTVIFYVAFVTASLAGFLRGSRLPRTYCWSAFFAGLAFCIRQDGMFLLPALWIAIAGSPHPRATKRMALIKSLAVYLITISPFLIHNYVELGSILPKGPSQTFFARTYQDIYSYGAPLDWESYRAWGWSNIIDSKLAALVNNTAVLLRLFGEGMWCLVLFGMLRSATRDPALRSAVLAVVFLLLAQFVFYALIGTTVASHGSYRRATMAVVPFLVVVAFKALDRGPSPLLLCALLIGLSLPTMKTCLANAQQKVAINNKLGQQTDRLRKFVDSSLEGTSTPTVLMTPGPWEVHLATGYPTAQLPRADIDTIYEVAQHYSVTHIIAPYSHRELTPALVATDPRFRLIAKLKAPPLRLFAVLPPRP